MPGLTRLSAALVLVGVLVVLPLSVWRGIGGIGTETGVDWSAVVRSGRVDADTVVALGLVVFTALWVWFALTAIAEVARIVVWRQQPMSTLAPVPPSPSGAVRRLVRAALMSTSTVVGAGLVSISGAAGVRAAVPAIVVAPASVNVGDTVGPTMLSTSMHDGTGRSVGNTGRSPAVIRSSGRDTPYSVAVRLGDALLRDRIIELNLGVTMPDGTAWNGGVFPAGMAVVVPEGLLDERRIEWMPYAVTEGDSVYRIATRLADGDNGRVRDLADSIIERNLGRVMVDGRVFDDPSLVRVGWMLDVPVASISADGVAPFVATDPSGAPRSWGETHVVVEGESYWSIAEDRSDDRAASAEPADIASLARDMMSYNAPLLGHAVETMLYPGDPVIVPVEQSGQVAADADGGNPAPLGIDEMRPAEVRPEVRPEVVGRPVSATQEPTIADPRPSTSPAPLLELSATDGVGVSSDAPELPSTADAVDGLTDGRTGPVNAGSAASSPAVAGADDRTGVTSGAQQERRSPVTTSLASAILLCAGALGLVESRRRQQLRRAGTAARMPQPTEREVSIERLVRSLDATQRAVRLDLALRCAGHLLVGTGGFVLAAIVRDDGDVTAILDRPGRVATAPWHEDSIDDRWVLPGGVSNDELAPLARLAGQPCPAVVHLGRLVGDAAEVHEVRGAHGLAGAGGELFVDLEAFGLVCIDEADADAGAGAGADTDPIDGTSGADAILHAIAASLAASPVGETLRLITHELDPAVHLGNDHAERARDFDEALDLAAAALGSTPTAIGHRRTSELRARGIGGEAWEPVVVVSGADRHDPGVLRELIDVTRGGGRGLAVVLRHAVEGASLTVRAGRSGWELERLGLTVVPVGLDTDQVVDLHRLIAAADQPVLEITAPSPKRTSIDPFVEPAWALMVRLLGGVDVVDRDGTAVDFDRGKSLELVAWLARHRAHATRGGARAALWDLDVRDSTFANVVSDARRSLARAVTPPDGEEWIARTLSDQLPMHPRVMTDVDLLQMRLDDSRGRVAHEAIEVLRPGVALIRDLSFAGTDYLWPDAEGITSALTLLATTAATELARHHLAVGDVDGVFWATGQGLRALPGHEELIGLRMRAHAQRGDLAGVRQEWEGYERAITADQWSDGEPSPKLLALRRQLLSA